MFPENKRLAKDPTTEPTSGADSESNDASGSTKGFTKPPRSRLRVWIDWVLGTVLLASLAVASTYGLHRYATSSPRFAVTQIAIAGNSQRSAEDIMRISGLKVGENIFSLRLDEVAERVRLDPWIETVSWSRRLPGTVGLAVTERKAAALVSLTNLYLLTATGKVFKAYEPGDPADLPIVTGFRDDDVQLDSAGFREELAKVLELLAEYNESPLRSKWPISELNRTPMGSYTLVVGRNATRVAVGSDHFRRKLEQVRKVFAELERRNVEASEILAENEARTDRVTVRIR